MVSSVVCLMGIMVWLGMTSLPAVKGHGRLLEPPSRSSMWRFGFPTPRNYDDNALNCGGLNTEWYTYHGKCGVCGDPWDQPQPRDNEAGGLYGKGIITRTYNAGQEIAVQVQITANHKGWFEFRLCVHNDPSTPITQQCLDRHLLQLADGSGTRYPIDPQALMVDLKLKLPAGVRCSQCVLQWKWHGGNNYGNIQEEFYGCSDIAIGTSPLTSSPPTSSPTPPSTARPTLSPTTPLPIFAHTTPGTVKPPTPGASQPLSGVCQAKGDLHNAPEVDRYCREQCPRGNCPSLYCVCPSLPTTSSPTVIMPSTKVTTAPPPVTTTAPARVTTSPQPVTSPSSSRRTSTQPAVALSSSGTMVCVGVGAWQGVPELDLYCQQQCPRGNCPPLCSCSPSSSPLPTTLSPSSPQPPKKQPCVAIGSWQGDVIKDRWCNTNCPLGICPTLNCRCGTVTTPVPTTFTPSTTTTSTTTTTTTTTTPSPRPAHSNPCYAVGPWAGDPLLDSWCKQTCVQFAGCDPQYCRCDAQGSSSLSTTGSSSPALPSQPGKNGTLQCKAINSWAGKPDLDRICFKQCSTGGPCPPEYCSCGATIAAASTTTTPLPTTTSTPAVTCYGVNSWAGHPDLDRDCDLQCKAGYCPPQYCACGPLSATTSTLADTTTPSTSVAAGSGGSGTSRCHAIGISQGVPEMDAWCQSQCTSGSCPHVYCAC